MSDPASPAIWPCGLRESHGGPDHPDFSSHLARCLVCRTDWKNRSGDSGPGLLPSKPLAWTRALVEANRRVKQPVPKAPTDDAAALPTPVAPGFVLGQPIRRTRHTQVFNATQVDLDRAVVVKFITCPPSVINFQLLAREGTILASLKHPHIVTIHQTGRWVEGLWLALEYCPKGSLALLLAEGLQANPLTVAGWVRKVAGAVHAAHRLGLLHNDIKPGNILLDDDGEPKLSDFGLAKKPEDLKRDLALGIMAGTPAYMAPEQARGGLADTRSDVHGLGAVLYHLLTGVPPFSGDNHHQILVQVAHAQPEDPRRLNPAIPSDLAAISLKCLSKNPEHRYQSAEALAQDLARFQAGRPVLARDWSTWESTRKWVARNRATTAALGLAFLLLVFSTALLAGMVVLLQRERENLVEKEKTTAEYLEKSQENLYTKTIQSAQYQMESGFFSTANAMLRSVPFQRRGWEHHYITGRLRQNQVTRFEHGGPVLGLAIRPDRKVFATVSADRSVRLWDAGTATQLRVLLEGAYPFLHLTWSSGGAHLAVVDSQGWVRVLDTTREAWSTAFQVAVDPNSDEYRRRIPLALSPDGSRVYACTPDHRIGEWSVASGERVRTFSAGHTGPIFCLALKSDRNTIISGGKGGKVCVWDARSGTLLRQFSSLERDPLSLAFSPDGNRIAAGCKDKLVHVWSVETGDSLLTLHGHEDWVNTVNFDVAGTTIVSGSDDSTIRLWDARTGAPRKVLRGHLDNVNAVRFSADGKRLFSTSNDGTIKVWDPTPSQGLVELPHPDWIRCLDFSPDGKTIATGDEDGFLRIWSVREGALLRERKLPTRRLITIRFSPDGSRLAVGGISPEIDIVDPRDLSQIGRLQGHLGRIINLAFSPDGSHLFSQGLDGNLARWDMAALSLDTIAKVDEQPSNSLVVSPDGDWLAIGLDNGVQLRPVHDWDMVRHLHGHTKVVKALAFSPDGRWLASGGNDRDIILWDVAKGAKIRVFEGHHGPVASLRFSPDGTRLLSSSFDRTVRLWNPATGGELIQLYKHRAPVRMATFSPDGQSIASAGDDNRVLLWDGSARMEEFRSGPFQIPDELISFMDLYYRSMPASNAGNFAPGQWPGPSTKKGWSITFDGADSIFLDRHFRAERLAREQALLATWK